MDKQINLWLQEFEIVKEMAVTIHSERLPNEEKSLAMQRSGFEDMPLEYVGDRGWKRRYSYMLLLKSESEIDKQRLANMDWLDELSDNLFEANQNNNFPILEKREVVNVGCSNVLTYQEGEDGAISIYSIQIYFDIKGGI